MSDSLRAVSVFTSLESCTADNSEVILLLPDSLSLRISMVNLCLRLTLFVPEVGKHYKWVSKLDFKSVTLDTDHMF